MPARIVVIGSSGQLGQEFENNFEFNQQFETLYYTKSQCNITDYDGTKKILKNSKPAIVINCAAYTNVEKSEIDQDAANNINNLAVENLAKLSNKYNFTLIHFSTDYVFNQSTGEPFKESDTKNPINFYGLTKHHGEEKIINIAKKYFIFRVTWVYGIYGNNFPKTIINLTKEKSKLNVVNDQIGVPTSTSFIVNTIIAIMHKYKIHSTSYGVYNCTPIGKCSWYDIASRILEKYKNEKKCICKKIHPVSSRQFKTIAKRPKYSVLNTESLVATFDINIKNWDFYFNDFLEKFDY